MPTADAPGVSSDGGWPVELVVVALGAVLVGVVLRFVARTPLWLDEALTVNLSELPLGDLPDALRRDGHPPLFYALLHGWMQVFGQSDVAVRALSGVISLVALPLAWVAGRRRGGRPLALVTVSVLALAPYALRYATETRMYALVTVLVLAGYLLLDDVVRREHDGWLRLGGIALVTAALLYTHYWGLWLVAATGVVLVWRSFRGDDRSLHRRARRALAALVVGAVLFTPWLPVMLYQSENTGTPWASPQRPTSVLAVTLGDFGGGGFRDAELVGTVLALLFVLGLFGRGVARDRIELELRTARQVRYEAVVAGLTMLVGTAAAYAASSAYASRYAAVVFPLFILVVSAGITRFVDRRVRLGVLVAVLALSSMGAYYGATAQRSQARQIGDSVAEHAQPGDLVVYCPDQLGPAGQREMPAGLDQVVFPTFAAPDRMDWVGYAERHRAADPAGFATDAAARAADRGIFFVWSGEYRTVEGRCEATLAELSALRPGGQVLVPDGGSDYYEHAQLVWFPAPA